ncbi:hypothetical protein AWB67_01644 [Caballeronia terrestris]|jgi:phage tail tape-measure protein|uniref:Acid shock protein n=2 Tax=Caballeronia TaxID=1827195 RepID=A0A158HCJ2_9BURK|nr:MULTISPECIES: hypothetical protein [Caballeronia]SAL14564.1 hypothetical protein AWB65_00555 [Caballeronia humi]SAL42104.1 hypothetical protein AWB67_01644 [Caballeronia terrestris]
MKKLTPVVAVAAAVLFTSGSSVAFAQTASAVSSYSPPMTEHKKKPKKPKAKKGASAPSSTTNGQSQ